jgi:hypothetical protein
MMWTTMHWTLFTDPGWQVVLSCAEPPCGALAGGGNYAVVISDTSSSDGSSSGGGSGIVDRSSSSRSSDSGSSSGSRGSADVTVIIEAFEHNASRCIRQDPPDWVVSPLQNVTLQLPPQAAKATKMAVWRSCSSWCVRACAKVWEGGRRRRWW